MKLKIGLMGLFWALASCGIKGPPLPPLSEETIQKQKAEAAPTPAPQVENTTKASDKKKPKKK